MFKKMVEDSHYTNRILDNVVNFGEISGSSFKDFCSKYGTIIYTIATISVLAPTFFLWSFFKAKRNRNVIYND